MTPLGASITAILASLVLCLSRRGAAVSIIAAVCYLSEGQQLDVAGVQLTAIRLVLLAGFVRVLIRRELWQLRFNSIDRAFVLYASALLIFPVVRLGTSQEFVYRIGVFGNMALGYFVFRSLMRDHEDFRKVLAAMAWVIVPFAALMLVESLSGKNPFSVFGGVYADSWVRAGHFRSAGPFRNANTAGAFGANFAILFAGILLASGSGRAAIGFASSVLIVTCARSSGPMSGLALGLLALGCWTFRRHARQIRWGIVAGVAALALVMKAPIWFLISRLSEVIGGEGYHRALLIDRFVNSVGIWWLAGTNDTAAWFGYTLPDGTADITNWIVSSGLNAGLVGLILSVTLVTCCFRRLGAAIHAARDVEPMTERELWGLGSTLVGSLGIQFSVTYFDQTFALWYFVLACVARVEVPAKGIEAPLPDHSPTPWVARPLSARRTRFQPRVRAAFSARQAALRKPGSN